MNYTYNATISSWIRNTAVTYGSIILLGGVVGNCLVLATLWFTYKQLRSSTRLLIILMVVADNIVLPIELTHAIILILFQYDFKAISAVLCKLYSFVSGFTFGFSMWMRTHLAIERFLVMWYPNRLTLRSQKRCVIAVVFLTFFALLILYITELRRHLVSNLCAVRTLFLPTKVYLIIQAMANVWLPGAISIASSAGILICQHQRQATSMVLRRQESVVNQRIMSATKVALVITILQVAFALPPTIVLALWVWGDQLFTLADGLVYFHYAKLIQLTANASNLFAFLMVSHGFRSAFYHYILGAMKRCSNVETAAGDDPDGSK